MNDADKALLANIAAHIRRKKMKRLIWRTLSAIGLGRRKRVRGRWAYPERRKDDRVER